MPVARIQLTSWEIFIFVAYLLVTVAVGFIVGRKGRANPRDYFLGDNKLPWYVIGTSMVASALSSDYFIAQVGAAYRHGFVIAAFGWNSWIVYTLLIWIFLPYYMRTRLYTMPEFLERRYDSTTRYLFAIFCVVGYLFSLIAGPLYAGGLALQSMFGINIIWGIVFLGVLTATYTVYGGLKSAAWTDFMQMAVLLLGGILVPIIGLHRVSGLSHLVHEVPAKFQVFHGPKDQMFPATGVFTSFLSVGIWYNCTSQHIVQRCLGAKDEWNARMGVVTAGFLHTVMPFLFVLPGIIAFSLFPHLRHPDEAYILLVESLVPRGLRGIILAAIAGALMSHLSAMINSTSTILTMDIYKRLLRPQATQRSLVVFGQWSGAATIFLGILAAIWFSTSKLSLFVLIQEGFAYIAPPFAVIFTVGLLWRRANATAAMTTIITGFVFTAILQFYFFKLSVFAPYANYLHRAIVAWVFCMIVMFATSLLTAPPDLAKTANIIWSPSYAPLPLKERLHYTGWKSLRLWWLTFIGLVLVIYGFFFWFRLQHPEIP
ncbi:MAG TPA: sodium/solute symporter [Acidobacteriaceae bacterium]|nr:sodium/solute symporter [Acidobacteriaceae bacterium]